MTPKEVRKLLQKEKEGWKVPGERRIAKFVKRQHSFKETRKGDGNGLVGRLFKGGKRNNNNNLQSPESHPGKSDGSNHGDLESVTTTASERERKGLRSTLAKVGSLAKVFSPSSKSKKPLPTTPEESFRKADTGKKGGAVTYKEAMADQSVASVVDNNEAEKPPAQPTEKVAEEEEVVTTATKDTEGENLVVEEAVVENLDEAPKEVFVDAYKDDNDGQKGTCGCEVCIIM